MGVDDKRRIKICISLSLGVFLVISGVINLTILPTLIRDYIRKSLVIVNSSSQTFYPWKDFTLPIITQFYFFNVTNPEAVSSGLEYPRLQEVGPIVFLKYRSKVNVSFSEDGTLVEYDVLRKWVFDSGKSVVSLDTEVLHLNVPVVSSAAFVSRLNMDSREKVFLYYSINQMHSLTRSSLFERHSIRQLMFDGYSDPLIQEAFMLNFEEMTIPFDRFGWFYGRNNSSDGRFKIYTGKEDISKLGQLYSWRNSTQISQRGCGEVKGVLTDFFPPLDVQKDPPSQVDFFVSDLCRPLTLYYEGHSPKRRTKGIKGHRYSFNRKSLDNSQKDNKCHCSSESGTSDCPPNGVIDTSDCFFDAPTALSLPHFLFSGSVVKDLANKELNGIHADFNKHSFTIDVHPVLGIPVSADISMQINVRMKRDDKVAKMSKLKSQDLYLPVLWFKSTVDIPPDFASKIVIIDKLPLYISLICNVMIGCGCLLIITMFIIFKEEITVSVLICKNRRRLKMMQKVLKQYDSNVKSIELPPLKTPVQTRSSF